MNLAARPCDAHKGNIILAWRPGNFTGGIPFQQIIHVIQGHSTYWHYVQTKMQELNATCSGATNGKKRSKLQQKQAVNTNPQ